jgi:3-hydroxybutyryl-CoA dehydrogenase
MIEPESKENIMKIEDIKRLAVIGLGKMGGDWVVNFLEAGFEVVGYDQNPVMIAQAPKQIEGGLKWLQKNHYSDQPDFISQKMANLTIVSNKADFIAHLQKSQIFLECVFEDMDIKCQLLQEYAPYLPATGLIWSNTSSLNIQTMAQASQRPASFIGTHGMNPVYQMPAVEVIRHGAIDPESITITLDILQKMGKIPFIAADVPGFWVNKQLVPFALEAIRALERGEITVADGDKGLKGSLGHPQGIFKLLDLIGLDTIYRVALAMYLATQDPRMYPPLLLCRMFKNKEAGLKSSRGFYEWEGFKAVKARDFSPFTIKDSNTLLDM